jgi:citrate lyase subunit beta/citryl-CoA lyase
MLIHPDQIAAVNAAFTPSPERLEWARRVLAGFAANSDAGVFALDGRMIDRPHKKLAERILAAG